MNHGNDSFHMGGSIINDSNHWRGANKFDRAGGVAELYRPPGRSGKAAQVFSDRPPRCGLCNRRSSLENGRRALESGQTTISFNLLETSNVGIKIYDINGKLVRTLLNSRQQEGFHSIKWNGRDNKGNMVSSGLYFYKMETETFSATKRMILLR